MDFKIKNYKYLYTLKASECINSNTTFYYTNKVSINKS